MKLSLIQRQFIVILFTSFILLLGIVLLLSEQTRVFSILLFIGTKLLSVILLIFVYKIFKVVGLKLLKD